MEAMIDRCRRNGAYLAAMKSAITNVLKSLLDHLTAPVSSMKDIGQEIQRTHRVFGKHED